MREISELLGTPVISATEGSSIPRVFFTDVASTMGIPQLGSMPELARRIIEYSHLPWHETFSSELSPSGGGGTVTALGLLQIKNAVLVWKGEEPIPLPEEISFSEWEPALDWQIMRRGLPRDVIERLERPGAPEFRSLVLSEYGNRCALTGFTTTEVIQVAHIVPYYGEASDDIQNAIPMRSDLHGLFDTGLIRIDYIPGERKFQITIHENIKKDYLELNKKYLKILYVQETKFQNRLSQGNPSGLQNMLIKFHCKLLANDHHLVYERLIMPLDCLRYQVKLSLTNH